MNELAPFKERLTLELEKNGVFGKPFIQETPCSLKELSGLSVLEYHQEKKLSATVLPMKIRTYLTLDLNLRAPPGHPLEIFNLKPLH